MEQGQAQRLAGLLLGLLMPSSLEVLLQALAQLQPFMSQELALTLAQTFLDVTSIPLPLHLWYMDRQELEQLHIKSSLADTLLSEIMFS